MKNQKKQSKNNKMTLKDYNLSFISGLLGFILLIAPIGLIAINAEDSDSVHRSVYDEDSARDDTYENTNDSLTEDVYFESDPTDDIKQSAITDTVYNSVTGDVYHDFQFDDKNLPYYQDEHGNIIVNNVKSISLPTNLIKNLNHDNVITLIQKDTEVTIPVSSIKSNLPEDVNINFIITVFGYEDLSQIFFLNVFFNHMDDPMFVDAFAEPIIVTVKIDPDKVTNWDNLVVRDHLNGVDSRSQILNINKETGEIQFEFTEISNYQIVEVEDYGEEQTDDDSTESETHNPSDDNSENNYDIPSVTKDVYYTITDYDDLKKHQDSDGNFMINNKVEVDIFPDIINELPNDKFIIMNQNGIQLAIPTNTLKDISSDDLITIEVREDPTNQDGVSKIYNINLLLNFELYTGTFIEPILATFLVDAKKVNNWDDLLLGTYDADWNLVQYKDQIIQIHRDSATVLTELNHLSWYGIFEVKGSGDKGEATEKPSTTDDVYYTIVDKDDLAGHYDKKGNIEFKDVENVVINGDVLSGLANNKSIVLTQKDAKLTIPVNVLKDIAGKKQVRFELNDVSDQFQDSLGTVLEFTLYLDGKKYNGKWKEPFQLTFKVDPKKVNNWDHLFLRFIDENGKVTDSKDSIVSVNKETGEVIAEVNQSGKYGIYEVQESGIKGSSSKEDNILGLVLPNTSTNMYNFLAIGAILFLVGFILLLNRKKQPK